MKKLLSRSFRLVKFVPKVSRGVNSTLRLTFNISLTVVSLYFLSRTGLLDELYNFVYKGISEAISYRKARKDFINGKETGIKISLEDFKDFDSGDSVPFDIKLKPYDKPSIILPGWIQFLPFKFIWSNLSDLRSSNGRNDLSDLSIGRSGPKDSLVDDLTKLSPDNYLDIEFELDPTDFDLDPNDFY